MGVSSSKIETQIDNIRAAIPGLAQWLEFDFYGYMSKEKEPADFVIPPFVFKQPITIRPTTSIRSVHLCVAVNESFGKKDWGMYQHCDTVSSLQIKFSKPVDVRDAIMTFHIFEEFFLFVFMKPNFNNTFSSFRKKGKSFSITQILYSLSPQNTSCSNADEGDKDVLTPLFPVGNFDSLQHKLQKWCLKYTDVKFVIYTLSFIRLHNMSIDHEFQTLVNAVEVVYRVIQPLSKKTTQKKQKDPTFRGKTKYIFDCTARYTFQSLPDNEFKDMKDLRDYFVHGEPLKAPGLLSIEKINYFNNCIKRCLRIIVLRYAIYEDEEELRNMISNAPRHMIRFYKHGLDSFGNS